MLQNSNLFFHLLIPVLSIITFVLFEKNNLKFKNIVYVLIPTLMYEIFYLINIFIHLENGSVLPIYDWYWFAQGGLWQIAIVGPLMLLITYILGIILWKLNRFFNQ